MKVSFQFQEESFHKLGGGEKLTSFVEILVKYIPNDKFHVENQKILKIITLAEFITNFSRSGML